MPGRSLDVPARREDDGDRFCIRSFWRIAFHAVYFTHLYLGQNEYAFVPWPVRRQGYYDGMWQKPWDIEPYEFPDDAEPTSKLELLDYIAFVDGILNPTIDGLDLESADSGIRWYKYITKLSHELLTLRHLQGHVGQISELLMARGVDIAWVSKP